MPHPIPRARFILTTTAVTFLLLPATAAAANMPLVPLVVALVDFRAEIGQWGSTPSGTVASGGDNFDVDNDLGFERDGATSFMVELEHPVPVLPNLRIRHSQLDDESRSTVTITRNFGPVQFQNNTRVRSAYDLEMRDVTFYYNPWNKWVEIDLGITARRVNLDVLLENRNSGDRERSGGSVWLPMGHLGARVELPLTGVYAASELNAVNSGGEDMQDIRASVGWEMTSNFGLAVGYRQLSLDFGDVDDLSADIDVAGPFATATLRF